MKLIIKKQENDRDFYNELLYISSKYPNFLKNPNLKVHNVTKVYGGYIFLAIIVLTIVTCSFLKTSSIILLLALINMVLLFILSIYFFFDSIKFINNQMKRESEASLTINKSGVRLERDKEINYSISYDDIKYVLINKYCVCFLPNKKTCLLIGVNSVYKDDIVKELKELKKDELIIDNSELYE